MIANYDADAGIHYGVIHANSCNPDAVQDIYDNGENLSYQNATIEAKNMIGSALRPVLDDLGVLPYGLNVDRVKLSDAYIADVVESVWSDIEQDWNDRYQGDGDDAYEYTKDGYVLRTTSLGIYVIKSPYYTWCAACSPCCPNAGDLDTPRLTPDHGLKTYALGPDWFDDQFATMPYTVYNVSDNDEVKA